VTERLSASPRAEPRFDEMLGADGRPRPHWAGLIETLARAEPARMRDRIATVEREIRDSGLTYNMYADPQGAERPWALDALPMIIGADEWPAIEAGIAQRARLIDAVLRDLYGAQTLLAGGLVPPRLVLGHGAFQRPACGIGALPAPPLIVYAADLARSPDGRWWVVADRTQAPSGAGYAIENRLIVSRIFPTLFRDLHAQRLAGFFVALRDALHDAAPTGDGPPLTVLLTPGPYNETYSEHSLLARYLGFTLVEGSDLTVRAGKVWLKTVDGLRRVHAILRRQDDDFCDPLELRADSALGVPGLVDCARRGSVLVANAIGAGVFEGGAMMGFLPRGGGAPPTTAPPRRSRCLRWPPGGSASRPPSPMRCRAPRSWSSSRPTRWSARSRCSAWTSMQPACVRLPRGFAVTPRPGSRRSWCGCRRPPSTTAGSRASSARAPSGCGCSRWPRAAAGR
jgi:uncharacterized circularly permuted ATP-grasp superfamily protein